MKPVYVSDEMHKKIKKLSAQTGEDMKQIAEKALIAYLPTKPKKVKP